MLLFIATLTILKRDQCPDGAQIIFEIDVHGYANVESLCILYRGGRNSATLWHVPHQDQMAKMKHREIHREMEQW